VPPDFGLFSPFYSKIKETSVPEKYKTPAADVLFQFTTAK
jgi:hypothetical protein